MEPDQIAALLDYFDDDLASPAAREDRPHVFSNFVSSLDGVVSYAVPGRAGGGAVSGGDAGDRLLMGLLRARCDAVVVGAGTLREVPRSGTWRPEATFPEAAELLHRWRARRTPAPRESNPLCVVVSGSGDLDLDRAIFRSPDLRALIATSVAGARRLAQAGVGTLPTVSVRALPNGAHGLDVPGLLGLLRRECGVRTLLHEGGPNLLGEFARLGALDEIFLTLSPRLAGRAPGAERPGMIEGVAFAPDASPGWHLAWAKSRGDFLYLRYRR